MKEKLLALLMVAVMVASAFGAMGLSATKVDAAGGLITLTLSSTNYYPSPGQQYTLSGLLTDPYSGNAYKPINILCRSSGDTTFHFSNTIYTDANGKYSTTTSSTQTVDLRAMYTNPLYGSVASNIVQINVKGVGIGTQLSLTTSNYAPNAGQQYTLAGRLTDGAGNGIAYQPIDIWYHYEGAWIYSNTIYTGADGKYSITTSSTQTVYIQAGFMGHGGYLTSSSNIVPITVLRPTLTLASTNYNPTRGQQYTFYGYLRDSAGNPLADKPIDIFYHYVGGSWQFSNTVKTDANGKYSTTTSSSKTVVLQTGYMVNGVYVASSNVVTITVQGGASATTLTLFGPDYTPKASALFTIYGSLRDSSGNLLSGESIEIWIKLPPPASITDWQYNGRVTTGATGGYSYRTGTGLSYMDIEAVYRGNTALGYSASTSDVLRVYTYGGY